MSKYFMHQGDSSNTPTYFRRLQRFANIPIHINLNLLSQSLRDGFGQVSSPFSRVPSINYNAGSGIGNVRVQPRVITDRTQFLELPIGPRLKNFLDYPLGDAISMNLRPPIYDTALGIGDRGGGWFRNSADDSAWHAGFDITRSSDNSLFQVCAAARGTVEGISRRDNAPVVIKHVIGRNEFLTIYQHLDLQGTQLRVGDDVGRGQFLGRISGKPGTPHLHFMVAVKGPILASTNPRRIVPAWFAIDAFGVYDYYLRRTNRTLYNYLPDRRPNCWNARIQGANHPIQWASQPLSSMM